MGGKKESLFSWFFSRGESRCREDRAGPEHADPRAPSLRAEPSQPTGRDEVLTGLWGRSQGSGKELRVIPNFWGWEVGDNPYFCFSCWSKIMSCPLFPLGSSASNGLAFRQAFPAQGAKGQGASLTLPHLKAWDPAGGSDQRDKGQTLGGKDRPVLIPSSCHTQRGPRTQVPWSWTPVSFP